LYDLYFPYLAFRFDGTTTQPLDPHGSFTDSFARGTNGDGSFIVGYSSVAHGLVLDGTRWDDDSPSKLTYDQQSLAFDVTPGGPVIVGAGLVPTDMPACEMYAFRLDSHNLVDLGRPAGSDVSIAQSVSDAGDAIVGSSARCDVDTSLFFFEAAFVWREGHEIADLRRVLTSGMGLDLTGWFLERAIAISGDGTTIVGYGRNPSGDVEGWRVQATPEEWEAALLAAKISTLPALTRTGVAMQIVATLLLGVGLIRGRRCAPNAPARERS
jgi:uncharacterized membrane protein